MAILFQEFLSSGECKQWSMQIADLCQNNSLLTFALCVALAPILLKYFPEINITIFHLVGRSSIGKTTALKVAAPVWEIQKSISSYGERQITHKKELRKCITIVY